MEFPRGLETYNDGGLDSVFSMLQHRIVEEPFNLFATIIFLLAIIHTFLTPLFIKKAHILAEKGKNSQKYTIISGVFHFLGEIEAVFGIWAIALGIGVSYFYEWETFVHYVGSESYIEPMFIVVIMTIASSRPVLKLFELILWKIVKLLGGTLEIWWFSILTLGPIMGSFITEPAAMVLSAHLLADKFYDLKPSNKLKYATLALLFVNISIGGTLTSFASPPVLIVSNIWNWDNLFMITHFGWKSFLAIICSNGIYFFILRKDFKSLREAYKANQYKKYIQRRFISKQTLQMIFDEIEIETDGVLGFTEELSRLSAKVRDSIKSEAYKTLTYDEIVHYEIEESLDEKFEKMRIDELKRTLPGLLPEDIRPPYRDPNWDNREDKVPYWIMGVHVLFMIWTLFNAHEPVLFIAGFMFFLGFFQITAQYQNRLDLKPALMVAFFLAGLIIHGGLQGWWIAPILGKLQDFQLFSMSTILTSFNDNASITYLSSLVTDMSVHMKYSVVAGALTGGGLTIIANSPNPVGQSILRKYFKTGISSYNLFKYALIPTIVAAAMFMLF